MKKVIKVYSLHPKASDLDKFIAHYRFQDLLDQYEFVWDADNPEYLFVAEHIYRDGKQFRRYQKYWEDGRKRNRVFIQYLEEAMRPDLNLFDYAVSYASDYEVGDRVGRILSVHNHFERFYLDGEKPANSMDEAKDWLRGKDKFCNFMYGHPLFERDEIFRAINSYKQVDSLGKHLHNTDNVSTGWINHEKETTTLRYPYKFTISAENGKFRGYTSEKLMTALQAHTVPIYWGNPEIGNDFNARAFINASDFNSLEDLVAYVKKVDENDELWCRYVCEPWQTEEQVERESKRMQEYIAFFDHIFSQPLQDAKRLEFSTHMYFYQRWFFQSAPPVRTIPVKVWQRLTLDRSYF